jgi:ABC-type uncharacterized transport system permease subunit
MLMALFFGWRLNWHTQAPAWLQELKGLLWLYCILSNIRFNSQNSRILGCPSIGSRMEPTLFSFIWKYSRREQMMLLFVTLITFPFLYVTLELPKRIINDAIGADNDQVFMLGVDLSQTQFLMTLCFRPRFAENAPEHDERCRG